MHYLGVVVFKNYLSSAFYEHFLLLHVAIKLLSSAPWCFEDNDYANELLVHFVERSEELYSDFFVSYNVHSLMHLAADSFRFGPIDSFSAYRFENHYGDVKRYLRKNDRPLQQLIKRLSEKDKANLRRPQRDENEPEDGHILFSERHYEGPVMQHINGGQFKTAKCGGKWELKCKEPDNCVMLTDSRVIIVQNFVQFNDQKYVVGRVFLTQQDYYLRPVPSSVLYEFKVSNLSEIVHAWNVEDIMYKCVKLPVSLGNFESFATFPLMMQ